MGAPSDVLDSVEPVRLPASSSPSAPPYLAAGPSPRPYRAPGAPSAAAMLDLPHNLREWDDGPVTCCALSVTMPDGAITSFFGDGKTSANARRVAFFKAETAVNEYNLNRFARDDDSSGTEEEAFLEQERTRSPDESPAAALGQPFNARNGPRATRKHSPMQLADPDSSDVELVCSVPNPHQSKQAPQDPDQSDSESDDEKPLDLLQGKLQIGKQPSPPVCLDEDTLDAHRQEPECEPNCFDPKISAVQSSQPPPKRNRQEVDPGINEPGSDQNIRSLLSLSDFDLPRVPPRPNRSANIPPVLQGKRRSYIVEPKTKSIPSQVRDVRDHSHLQAPVGQPTFDEIESILEASISLQGNREIEPYSRDVESSVERATAVAAEEAKVNVPASSDPGGDIESNALDFHEVERTEESPSNSPVRCAPSQLLFREAEAEPDAPASQSDDSESDVDLTTFSERATKAPPPLIFKSVNEEPASPQARSRSESPEVQVVEVTTTRSHRDKRSESSKESDGSPAKAPSAPCVQSKGFKARTHRDSSKLEMYTPNGYTYPRWMQYNQKQTVRKQRQRPVQTIVPMRRKTSDQKRRPVSLQQEGVGSSQNAKRRTVGNGETLRHRSETNPGMSPSIDSSGAPSFLRHGSLEEEETGWGAVLKAKSSSGKRFVVPIPRVRKGTPDKASGKSASSRQRNQIVLGNAGMNRGDTAYRAQPDPKMNHTDGRGRGGHNLPSSNVIRTKHNNSNTNGYIGDNTVPRAPSGYGMNGISGMQRVNSTGAHGMNGVSSVPWFPPQQHMRQTHHLPPHGHVAPLQPPNMFVPVVAHNPYFPTPQPHPSVYGYNAAEDAEWQRQAVGAAWLDYQRAPPRKPGPEKRSRHGDNGAGQSGFTPPKQSAGTLRSKDSLPSNPRPEKRTRLKDNGAGHCIFSAPKESAPRESAPKESAPRESAPKESARRESALKESAPRESAGKESAGKESAVKECAGKECAGKESARKDACPKDFRLKDSPPKEPSAEPKRSRDIKSPETPTTVLAPAECSSGDEEDGEDHVSMLHVMTQKIRSCSNPDFQYNRNGLKRWDCTVTVKVLRAQPGEKLLSRIVSARGRKRAKQKASKRLVLDLKECLSAPKDPDSSENDSAAAAEAASMSLEKLTGISTAMGALNQLWHWKKLDTQPDVRFEDAERGMWRCVFIMTVPDIGIVHVSEEAAQKKIAKSMASFKALQRLRELKVLRVEEFANLKPPKFAREETECSGKGNSQGRSKACEPKQNTEQISDGDVCDMEAEDNDRFEGRLVLPKEYTLVIASTSQECDVWLKANAKPGTSLGIYIDSLSARKIFDEGELSVAHDDDEMKPEKQPFLCLSSKKSGLVVRRDYCQDEKSMEVDCVDGFWLPKAIRLMLKDDTVQKFGHSIEDGLLIMEQLLDVHVDGMNDIAIFSHALSASSHTDGNGSKVLRGLAELTKHWLKREVFSTNLKDIWTNEKESNVLTIGADEAVGTAVVSAFACTRIQGELNLEAARARSHLYGAALEFQDLSSRIMMTP